MSKVRVNKLEDLAGNNGILVSDINKATQSALRVLKPALVLPTTRDNGSPLQVGDIITNLTDGFEYKYTGSGWLSTDSNSLKSELEVQSAGDLIVVGQGGTSIPRKLNSKLKDTVSILDYYDPSNPSTITTSFAAAFAAGKGVEIPSGLNITGMNTNVIIPDGKDLICYGNVSGTATGRFEMQGSGEFVMQGGLLTNVSLLLQGGTPRVRGYRFTGRNHTQAILIQGTGQYKDILIDDIEIYGANFGILRQGAGSSMVGAQVTRGRFSDLRGDCIEWNVCANDRNMLFVDHTIDQVSSVNSSQAFWGIGIGVAGAAYNNSYPDSNTVKDFTIAQIRGSRCRQLVHVENGNRFDISEINGYDISDAYSPLSGLSNRTVVVYGSTNFDINQVNSYAGTTGSRVAGAVSVEYGIVGGAYISAPQNYRVSNINMNGGSVILNTGNTGTSVTAQDITIEGGRFELFERPGKLVLKNIKARRKRSDGKSIILNLDHNVDGREAFRSGRPSSIEVTDCEGLDEFMTDSFSVLGMVQDKVSLKGNNFEANALANGSSRVTRDINRTLYGPSNGIPYGKEFVNGDLFFDSVLGVRYLFTGGGSLNRVGDTFTVNGTTGKFVRSTNHSWTAAFMHEVGQRVILTFTGGEVLTTTVVRAFSSGGNIQLELSDPIVSPDGTTGTITSATVATYILA